MTWNDTRFDRFVTNTIQMARGALPGFGYPHVIFPYPVRLEKSCIEAVRGPMRARLGEAGLGVTVIPVAKLVAEVLRRYARRDLRTAREYLRLQLDLADLKEGLIPSLARLCAKELPDADNVMVLCRLGALHPFGHISSLLDAIYRTGARNTLAVAYPGTVEGAELRFLGLVDPTGGYRGHIVT